jgi:hypothetical protein
MSDNKSLEERIKAGHRHEVTFMDKGLYLSFDARFVPSMETGRLEPFRGWIVEYWDGPTKLREYLFDDLDEALTEWNAQLEKHAHAIAVKALGLKLDTVKMIAPPKFDKEP